MLNARSTFQFRGGRWKPSNSHEQHEVWMSCNGCTSWTASQFGNDLQIAVDGVLKWATLAGWARIDNEEFCPECAVKQAHRLEGEGLAGGQLPAAVGT